MPESTVWWVLTGAAVAIELFTGTTFYLLMLAIGLAAGALAAHAGLSQSSQLLAAAVVGGGAVIAWHNLRDRGPAPQSANANRDVNLDIGETVQVDAWNADGTAEVRYRGAHWSVLLRPGQQAQTGAHKVVEVQGNRLIVEPIA